MAAIPSARLSGAVDKLNASYNSFSGVDIHIYIGRQQVAEVQGVSFTVTREKAPIYTMGRADPRSYSRGKRGIAGSMIAVVFDKTNLLGEEGIDQKFWADADDITRDKLGLKSSTRAAKFDSNLAIGGSVNSLSAGHFGEDADRLGAVAAEQAWYHDQLPPFTIGLIGYNEYGHGMTMELRGCEILNIGSGISVDDITTDENMTFVCRTVLPWRPLRFRTPKEGYAPGEADPLAFSNATAAAASAGL
jgi:hypothetical protein